MNVNYCKPHLIICIHFHHFQLCVVSQQHFSCYVTRLMIVQTHCFYLKISNFFKITFLNLSPLPFASSHLITIWTLNWLTNKIKTAHFLILINQSQQLLAESSLQGWQLFSPSWFYRIQRLIAMFTPHSEPVHIFTNYVKVQFNIIPTMLCNFTH